MEYCCVGVIFLLAATFAVLGLVFMLQYRSRVRMAKDATAAPEDKPSDEPDPV